MSSLKHVDRLRLEKFLEMGSGYVCDFSDRTFGDFIMETVGIDVYTTEYEVGGTSKANRLRTFWKKENDSVTSKLLEEIIEYRKVQKRTSGKGFSSTEMALYEECLEIVRKIKGEEHTISNADMEIETKKGILEILNDPKYPQRKRSFSLFKKRFNGLNENDLRRILRNLGAQSFRDEQNDELWGLRTPALIQGNHLINPKIEDSTIVGVLLNVDKLEGSSIKRNTSYLPDMPKSLPPMTFNNSHIHFGKGDNVGQNKITKSEESILSKHYWYLVVPILVFLIGYILTEEKIPKLFQMDPELKQATSSQQVTFTDKLKPLQPLETGKSLGSLPDNSYFYSDTVTLAYEIRNPAKGYLKAQSDYRPRYSFEIQKIDSRYYVIGFVSDELYSRIGEVSEKNPLYLALSPYKWGGATHTIAIPFDKVYTAEQRIINLDESSNMSVLDIGFREAETNAVSHQR